MTERIDLRRPDDWHVHLRSGDMLTAVLPYTGRIFARALVMPNLRPRPVLTAHDAMLYQAELRKHNTLATPYGFQPLMTIQINADTQPSTIQEAADARVVAGKVYPKHGTTNSDNGVTHLRDIYSGVLDMMARERMVLCVHAEKPHAFVLDREAACVEDMLALAKDYPKLKIVWEHVSSKAGVEAVLNGPPNLAATITAHHLLLTLDDVVGKMVSPHAFCMPVAKTAEDRQAVIDAAISGNPKFFFGSDSAPHLRMSKECANGAAGIFSAPCAMEVLAEVFEFWGALERLEAFTSEFGAQFYGLPLNNERITLVRKPHVMPDDIAGIRPFKAGETLNWKVL